MSLQNHNGLAYDLSLFEPETVEESPYVEEVKKDDPHKVVRLDAAAAEQAQKRKRNPVKIFGVSLLMIVVAVIFSMILYNYVVLNEYNSQILLATKTLSDQENLKAQYQLKIGRSLPDEMVQQYAESKLNMTQANSAQKEFISLTDGDRGEVLRGDERDSFLTNIKKIFHVG